MYLLVYLCLGAALVALSDVLALPSQGTVLATEGDCFSAPQMGRYMYLGSCSCQRCYPDPAGGFRCSVVWAHESGCALDQSWHRNFFLFLFFSFFFHYFWPTKRDDSCYLVQRPQNNTPVSCARPRTTPWLFGGLRALLPDTEFPDEPVKP